MKTAVEMINEVTKFGAVALTRDSLSELLKAYAQSAIDEIKEKIAQKASMVYHCGHHKTNEPTWYVAVGEDNIQIDKESIRSVTIELK